MTHPHPDFPAEEARLGSTVQAMIRRIQILEDRERHGGADEHTSLVMADDAEERAAVLSPHVHSPYFGRMTVRIRGKERTLYIGKHAFGNPRYGVTSWRSDVGGLFYTDQLQWQAAGNTGTVLHKRQLDVQNKRLLDITDLYTGENKGEQAQQEGNAGGAGRRKVLLKRLSEHATAGMRDVVETLQPAQYDAMTADPARFQIVQGSAGAGKTTVGFHRLAWLCGPDRPEQVRARPEGILALMPNDILAAYASRVLPGLELQGVTVTTPEKWMLSFLGLEKMQVTDRTLTLLLADQNNERRASAWKKAKALGRASIYDLIREHVRQELWARLHKVAEPSFDVPGRGSTGPIPRADLWELIEHALSQPGATERFRASLEEAIRRRTNATDTDLKVLDKEIGKVVTTLFGRMLPVSETRRLLGSEALLERAKVAEPLRRILLSDPLAAIPLPKGSSVDVTELPAILALRCILHGLGERWDHILLDEAQDFQPLLYRLLAQATRPGQLTALGDLSQGLAGYKGPANWEEVQQALGRDSAPAALGSASVSFLPMTYRSTAPISEASARIAATYSKVIHSEHIGREGDPVQFLEGELGTVAGHVQALQDAGYQNIALVTRRTIDAQRLPDALAPFDLDVQPITEPQHRYKGGLVSIPVQYAKGLEFDGCVVMDADPQSYDPGTEYDSRLLYVAASRGLHHLAFYSGAGFHPLVQG
ncbi:putative UvrD/rep helicase family protein (plasmid) [Deinococcus proteolyticus MRP]|uniref:Putative UvrD/rep helicase family protein n=1 Tax=Deinococcus proteolyticus (strain ATCC 35074 / DSM 20540 / JCM 6276 / NBRC 101906 / NCIMB 13154 / VKM Ac-1939 / CCM 2703 / MRP) TaxID=693977 RepID=F0RQR3_DEIPM|nr:UvrD/REP helicase [Deinococcus proteolyticus]ADY27622.1 putative UvrD/rep helicase family protein [Deinococcus proteolyticus MRP]